MLLDNMCYYPKWKRMWVTVIGVKIIIKYTLWKLKVNKLEVFECGKLFLCYLGGGVYNYTCLQWAQRDLMMHHVFSLWGGEAVHTGAEVEIQIHYWLEPDGQFKSKHVEC